MNNGPDLTVVDQEPGRNAGQRDAVIVAPRNPKNGILKTGAALLFTFLISLAFVSPRVLKGQVLLARSTGAETAPQSDRFDHAKHNQLKCDHCHLRRTDAVKPALPGHQACVSCHVKEFTSTGFGICSNCHDGISAVRPPVVPFPERKTYGLEFSHATHATTIGGEKRADCSSCHGVAGARATFPGHRECYVCHKAPDQFAAGEKVVDGSCGVCHTSSGSRNPLSAGGPAYRYRFSHQVHVARVANCTECHRVLGERGGQVSQPRLSEHRGAGFSLSCGTCHNGRRAFGGEIEHNACARCHGRPMI